MDYTKGNWYIWHTNNAGDIIQTTQKQIATIVGAYGWDEKAVKESLANANLISASPELFESLKAILNDYEHCVPDEDGNISNWRMKLIKQANKALAKAEGKE